MEEKYTGAQIRQTFIDYFVELGHTFVPSSSLVPGGDQTLLFTNAGMVQFKDVFLGIDKRPYKRATNSQKCMRVAGKHNDLEDVGRDDTHHTFFEMLGNWSFGDYYKKEAITWAWELLTNVWELPKEKIWATCFQDEKGEIPQDDEAADAWREQPGFIPSHVLFFGRKENFWEMAETGPCGPCSEIHLDRGIEYCIRQDVPGHECRVNGDCQRYIELWNLVFIQYSRLDETRLEPLPQKHVDTGAGLDRIVSVLQNTDSNYKTDLFWPLVIRTQELTGHSDEEREANFTPYRVIADHSRAAAFLIADGVVPGNLGRNYVTRMIIRRAYRFGGKIGLNEPFLADIASEVIEQYSGAYPELKRNREAILSAITREEEQFQRTLDRATAHLENLLNELVSNKKKILPGVKAADLYTTFGMPFEITRDIAQERGLDVDEEGFQKEMEHHRLISGAGKAMGKLGGEDIDIYHDIAARLMREGKLGSEGVEYDPYNLMEVEGPVLALLVNGETSDEAQPGDSVEIILPKTGFYVEAGGQVSDTGTIIASNWDWEIRVDDMRKPISGIYLHIGEVVRGNPKVGDIAIASVDAQRRRDIMRNHTATHLLHAELRTILGEHARQAGSLVAPDRLRFDFTHPEALTKEQLERIEAGINRNILGDFSLNVSYKPLQQAISEGAMALFGEKYSDTVRTITIGGEDPFSYELCGGTHVQETGDIGICLITSEGSVASGIRRIEAVTGRKAYELVHKRSNMLEYTTELLNTTEDQIPEKITSLQEELSSADKQLTLLRQKLVAAEFQRAIENIPQDSSNKVLVKVLPGADSSTLRTMADRFRQQYPENGVVVLGTVVEEHPLVVAAVTDDLIPRGIRAGDLVKAAAITLGGGGGGRPTIAEAGGKDASKLEEALDQVESWINDKLGKT